MQKSNSLPFPIGTYAEDGQTIDTNAPVLGNLEGQEYILPDINPATQVARTTRQRTLRVVRNLSGTTIYGKRLVKPSVTAGVYRQRIIGVQELQAARSYPTDEYLDARGVPANGLFYVVVAGPAMCTSDGTSAAAIAVGDEVISFAAGTSGNSTVGQVCPFSINNGTTANSTNLNGLRNRIGVALSAAASNAATNVLIDVNIAPW